jgi:hypothetical protein
MSGTAIVVKRRLNEIVQIAPGSLPDIKISLLLQNVELGSLAFQIPPGRVVFSEPSDQTRQNFRGV